MLIIAAAAFVGTYAVGRFFNPVLPEHLGFGTGLTVVAALINLVVGQILLRVGRANESIVLKADGQHLMTDVWTSLGVVAGLGLVWLTKQPWLDAILGLVVAAQVAWTGLELVWTSFNGLMDHALPAKELAEVRRAIETRLEPSMDFHALRTRRAGSRRFADFHLLVPGVWSVRRAHEITKQIEKALGAALPGIEVTVHVEPIEDRAAWEDSELVPLEQAARRAELETPPDSSTGVAHGGS